MAALRMASPVYFWRMPFNISGLPPSLPSPPPSQLRLPKPSILKPGPRSPLLLCPQHKALSPCRPCSGFLGNFWPPSMSKMHSFGSSDAGRLGASFPHHPAGSSKCRVIFSWCPSPAPPARGRAARIEPTRKIHFWKHPKRGTRAARARLLSCFFPAAHRLLQVYTWRAGLG